MVREVKFKFAAYKICDAEACIRNLDAKGWRPISCVDATFRLYVKAITTPVKWVKPLRKIVTNPDEINFYNSSNSFVMFKRVNEATYAFTGGIGYFSIQDFIQPDFGLDIVSKLVKPDKIKYIKRKALAGRTVQDETVFKELYNYDYDSSNWGRISKEILGELNNRDVTAYFGLNFPKKIKIRLDGKDSLQINKSLSFEELDVVFGRLHEFDNIPRSINIFKGYEEVENHTLKQSLFTILVEDLKIQYTEYLANPNQFVEKNIFLSYLDAKQFILTDVFIIDVDGFESDEIEMVQLHNVFSMISECRYTEFEGDMLTNIYIRGYADEDEPEFVEMLKAYIVAEVVCGGKTYCYLDKKWYELKNEFRQEVEAKTVEVLGDRMINLQIPAWPITNGKLAIEDVYIENVCSLDSITQLHRDHVYIAGRDKAEVCDIVDTRINTKFMFVKRGTGSTFRDLLAQVRNSVELFLSDANFRERSIAKINAKQEAGDNPPDYSNVQFVILVTDDSVNRAGVPLIEKMTAIAKIDLINTVNFLWGLGVQDVLVYEVPHQ